MNDPAPNAPARSLDRTDRLWLVALIVAFSFLFMWNAWSYELWDPWEPKYAGTVAEMRERGEVITPWFNDKIRWTKPVLTYWLMYVPIVVFGNTEFSARLPMMILAVLGVLMTYYVLRRLRGRTTAILGACILGTQPQYFYMARQAMPDMPLNVFLGFAMGLFALGRFADGPKRLYFLGFYACAALAFLTKGPVSAVLIIGSVLIFWLFELDRDSLTSVGKIWAWVRSRITTHHLLLGTVIFFAIAGPWYGAMWVKHGDAFTERFIGDENLDRFTEPIRGHHGTLEHYVGTLFRGYYPWIGLLPVGAFFLFQGTRKLDEDALQRWFFLSWFAGAFLLFTVAGTKLDHYILPISIPTAILVALIWEAYFERETPYWVGPVFLASIPFVFLPIRDFIFEGGELIFDVFITKRPLQFPWWRETMIGFFCCWVAVMLLGFLLRRSKLVATAAVLLAFANGVYFTHHVMPAHSKFRNMKPMLEHYQSIREPDSNLVFYGWMRYSMYYYYGKDNFRHFEYNEIGALDRYVGSRSHVYIIGHRKYVDRLFRRFGTHRNDRLVEIEVPVRHARFMLLKIVPKTPADDDD